VSAPARGRFGGRIETEPEETGVARAEGGVRIAWRAYGEGQPVVLVMGFMGSGHAWFRLLPHIAAGRRAILLDNRGTGDSDRPLGLWSMDDLAADVLAVLDDADLERPHVIGASMGGMIVQHLALAHAERLQSLTLCCTSARSGGRRGPPPWRMIASLGLRPVLGPGRTMRVVSPLLYSERTRHASPERLAENSPCAQPTRRPCPPRRPSSRPSLATTRARAWGACRCRLSSCTATRTSSCHRPRGASWPPSSPARSSSSCPLAATC